MTSDGFILEVYRIPGILTNDPHGGENKPPVLMIHALEMDHMEWVMNHPDIAPAFILARQGYDVWLGNNRGNRWSQKHLTMDPKHKEFWQWSWEEMGTKDVPAMTDHIIKTTGFK